MKDSKVIAYISSYIIMQNVNTEMCGLKEEIPLAQLVRLRSLLCLWMATQNIIVSF